MQIFYINLARSTERRANMERQFEALGLSAERIEAVTPADIPPEMIRRYCEPRPLSLRWVEPTELACTLSHRKAWSRVIDDGLPGAIIFEDDALLSPRLPQAIPQLSATNADVVHLETRSIPVTVGSGTGLQPIYTYHPGTCGYAITRDGARKLLACKELDFTTDDLIFDPRGPMFGRLRVRQMVPALCIPDDVANGPMGSEVGDRQERVRAMDRRRRRLPHGVARRLLLRAREEVRERVAKLSGAVTKVIPLDD